jgi:hypothetical protein
MNHQPYVYISISYYHSSVARDDEQVPERPLKPIKLMKSADEIFNHAVKSNQPMWKNGSTSVSTDPISESTNENGFYDVPKTFCSSNRTEVSTIVRCPLSHSLSTNNKICIFSRRVNTLAFGSSQRNFVRKNSSTRDRKEPLITTYPLLLCQ